MEFKTADRNDLPGILELYRHLNPEEQPLAQDRAEVIWQEIESHPGIVYLVAVENGKVVSTCNLSILPNLTRGGHSLAILENVVTDPAWRRQGLGRKLLERAIEHAKARGCYKVSLMSNARRTEAHGLYISLGFDGQAKRGFHLKLG